MKQLAQDYRTGIVRAVDVPAPTLRAGGVLVRTHASLVSVGTERGKVSLARESLASKARKRPEAVAQVVQTIRSEGLEGARRRVSHKLDQLSPLGYSAAGTVIAVGSGVDRFRVGDRVAVGGGGYANHAEVLWVPHNLVARVPDNVEFEHAAFATVGAIALHGVRLSGPGLGETVGVIGLGLVGQLAARLALAAGCRVVGCDLDPKRCQLAEAAGIAATSPERFVDEVRGASGGIGADSVLVAAASASSEPMRLAIEAARDRARIVAIGAVAMDLPRDPMFKKEVSVVVSRSYGPGRYDPKYEEGGRDYPVSYVRWTEGRNLEAVVDLIAAGRLEVDSLIDERYDLAEAPDAYDRLVSGESSAIGVILRYPDAPLRRDVRHELQPSASVSRAPGGLRVGLIGAGSFASNVLMPSFRKAGAELVAVASASGLSAQDAVTRAGFARAHATAEEVIEDPEVDIVVIATPHNLHARLALQALGCGKAAFVEKPLAIHESELTELASGLRADSPLFVGFNRRFSPHAMRVADWVNQRGSAAMVTMRVNAGRIPSESWIHDPAVGGGRLVGEGCHFVDLANALLGPYPSGVRCIGTGSSDPDSPLMDNFVLTLDYEDGSLATVVYTSKGNSRLAKESVEVFSGGRVAVIDNWDRVNEYTTSGRRVHRSRSAKGHAEEVQAFLEAWKRGLPMPVPVPELLATTRATIEALESLKSGGQRRALVE